MKLYVSLLLLILILSVSFIGPVVENYKKRAMRAACRELVLQFEDPSAPSSDAQIEQMISECVDRKGEGLQLSSEKVQALVESVERHHQLKAYPIGTTVDTVRLPTEG